VTLREDLLASTTSSPIRLRKNYCSSQQFSSFLDAYKTVLLRMLRDPDGVLAREVGMTKTMKRKWGWISNIGGCRVRTIRCFEYRIVRWARGR
jgi:hypothetical protein